MNLEELLGSLPELEENKNVCIALSGGLDSTTLVYCLVQKYGKDRVKALSFDYGQMHVNELDLAIKTVNRLNIYHQVIDLRYLGEMVKGVSALVAGSELQLKTAEENSGDPVVNSYIPQRNSIFAFNTAAFAEANNCRYVFQGLNATDEYSYPDNGSVYVGFINDILNLNRKNLITFLTPFVELYKGDELKIAQELSNIVDYDITQDFWSCYRGDDGDHKQCGTCNTCSEVVNGYLEAGYTNEKIASRYKLTLEEIQKRRGEGVK